MSRTVPARRLEMDDETGRMTLSVLDFDEADALAALIGVEHEDGYFDLGHVKDMGLPAPLWNDWIRQWLAWGRVWDANEADRSRPETFTVPPYVGRP